MTLYTPSKSLPPDPKNWVYKVSDGGNATLYPDGTLAVEYGRANKISPELSGLSEATGSRWWDRLPGWKSQDFLDRHTDWPTYTEIECEAKRQGKKLGP